MSTLVIDTIQGKTTAGSVNVRGEGSKNTNLQQGLAKAWINHDFGSDNSANDSFNISSTTDNSTANMDITFSNPMNNSTYSVLVGQTLITALNGVYYTGGLATTKFIAYARYNQAYYEWSPQHNLTMGDLA